MKNINGFDTETINGKVILLMDSGKNYIYNDSEPLDFLDCIEFLYNYGVNKHNYFFNLKYDIRAIFKCWIDNDLQKLKQYREFERLKMFSIENYDFFFIPGKMFKITKKRKDKHKKSVSFYDILNFYKGEGNLNQIGIKYFDIGKDEFSYSDINKKYLANTQNLNTFINYCFRDCWITEQLSKRQHKLLSHIVTGKGLISPASVSRQWNISYLSKNNLLDNYFIDRKYFRFCLNSYFGGRFEDTKRGFFDTVYYNDINSAYPYSMYKLNQLTGNVNFIESFNENDIYHFYGIYIVRINPFNFYINPLPIRKRNGTVMIPSFKEKVKLYLTYYDVLTLKKLGVNFEILNGFAFEHNGKPILSYIENMYEKRKKLKADKDEQQQVLKIILNSTYGLMLQCNKKLALTTKDKSQYYINGKYYREYYRLGKLFNPLYATYVTSYIRYMLYWASHGNNIIGYATDSIFSLKELKLPISEELGEWESKIFHDNIFVKTGIRKNDNDYHFRGDFSIKENVGKDNIFSLWNMEENFKDIIMSGGQTKESVIPISHLKKYGNNVHTFSSIYKNMRVNNDMKRNFPYIEPEELFIKNFDSKPVDFSGTNIYYKKGLVV